MLHFRGETRVTAGSDAPPGAESAKRRAGTGGRGVPPLPKPGSWVQIPAPPLACRIIAGNLPISKQMVHGPKC